MSIISGYASSLAPKALPSNWSSPGTNVATPSCRTVNPKIVNAIARLRSALVTWHRLGAVARRLARRHA
jgi:hypothetical protein